MRAAHCRQRTRACSRHTLSWPGTSHGDGVSAQARAVSGDGAGGCLPTAGVSGVEQRWHTGRATRAQAVRVRERLRDAREPARTPAGRVRGRGHTALRVQSRGLSPRVLRNRVPTTRRCAAQTARRRETHDDGRAARRSRCWYGARAGSAGCSRAARPCQRRAQAAARHTTRSGGTTHTSVVPLLATSLELSELRSLVILLTMHAVVILDVCLSVNPQAVNKRSHAVSLGATHGAAEAGCTGWPAASCFNAGSISAKVMPPSYFA